MLFPFEAHSQVKDSAIIKEMPFAKFPGGDSALRKHLDTAFIDPLSRYCISTCFRALVTISEDGNILSATIVTSSNFKEIDDAFIKTCMSLPKFEPATINDKKVTSYYYVFYDIDMDKNSDFIQNSQQIFEKK